ncbi:hypothetical protein T459_02192 [Capsicum annuum]|uniref:Uncharacterized protein n=1 Tax=Capsicum annuum TaxID=4072 RepID=A0A2G3AJD2_CAPAN|nr:hypothetical protein T459_02192 [Capsicum annuum]
MHNSIVVQSVVAIERTVSYRERAVGMFSTLRYAFGQDFIEIPYIFVQSFSYGVIDYAKAEKVIRVTHPNFVTLMGFTQSLGPLLMNSSKMETLKITWLATKSPALFIGNIG